MKVVCICDVGVPEKLMAMMGKLPGCEVTYFTEPSLNDVKATKLALRAVEMVWEGKKPLWLLAAFGWCLLGAVTFVDYGAYGVMMVLVFGLSRRLPYAKLFQLAAMILINVVLMEGQMLIVFGREFPVQGFAVLALLPIWLYNGEKGRRSKALQTGFYLFYPIHMLILAAIRYFT